MAQIKKTIANHGIKEEDLDNVLNQTFNAIPGLDEATKNEYKNQFRHQIKSYSKDDWMKILGGVAAATGLSCFGCCALCKKEEDKEYNEQKDEIEVQSTYND